MELWVPNYGMNSNLTGGKAALCVAVKHNAEIRHRPKSRRNTVTSRSRIDWKTVEHNTIQSRASLEDIYNSRHPQ